MPPREPLLEWIEVLGFRAFRHLRVNGLARVNLLVGKNNVGKSSLLEAVWLLSTAASPRTITEILTAGDENVEAGDRTGERLDPTASPLLSMFHGRGDLAKAGAITLDSNGGRITARIEWYKEGAEGQLPGDLIPINDPAEADPATVVPVFQVRGKANRFLRLDMPFRTSFLDAADSWDSCKFIAPGGVTRPVLWRMWDKVVLTPVEDDVVRSLEFIAPGIERLSFVGSETSRSRIAIARVKTFERAVPLKSLGDGVNRVLGLVLALATTRNGVVLVDEIENGIHYSAQESLWDLLINAAEHFNVQIFATTHSSDSIRAFQRAANRIPGENGALIRLERRGEDIFASRFSKEELETADRAHVEVR